MQNITLSKDEDVLVAVGEYARRNNISFNVLVRRLMEQTVVSGKDQWLEATFGLMNEINLYSARFQIAPKTKQGIPWAYNGKIIDFGVLEIQAVYISENVISPSSLKGNWASMICQTLGQAIYPQRSRAPFFTSSVRI
jgi:hypothetical protein